MRIVKDTVSLLGIRPELVLGLVIADGVMRQHGVEARLTSVTDGRHSTTSLHYAGCAADLRIWGLDDVEVVAADLRHALGPDFDVVAEATHIHFEWQPRRR